MEYVAVAIISICITFLICLLVGTRMELEELRSKQENVPAPEPEPENEDFEAPVVEQPVEKINQRDIQTAVIPLRRAREQVGDDRVADVTSALQNLGFSKKVSVECAERAIQQTPGGSTEDAVVAALRLRNEA